MKYLIVISFLLFGLLPTIAQNNQYPYVMVTDGTDMSISDDDFYEKARSVIFQVSKWDIPENDEFAQEIINDVLPKMDARGLQLKKIMMRGAASPEGSHEWNVKLGQNRLNAIYDIIKRNAKIPVCDDCIHKVELAEDYPYLLRVLKRHSDPDYETVRKIVMRYGFDDVWAIKRELKKINGMKLWKRLLEEYFPELRAARVVLFFAPYDKFNPLSTLTTIQPDVNLVQATPIDTASVLASLQKGLNMRTSQTVNVVQGNQEDVVQENALIESRERQPRREFLSVKTNLLMDFAYMPAGYDRFCSMPNVGIEYYPKHGHFTFGASFDIPWHQDYDGHKYFQARNYQLETRYYFRSGDIEKNPPGGGAAFRGLYLQGYGQATRYGIMFSEHRGWVGEGAGAGIGLGYVMPLTKPGHLRLEIGAQFGWFYTKYDPFQYECPVDPTEHDNLYYYKWTLDAALFKKRQYVFTWMGPTKVGLTLTYDLLYRKYKKKGTSLKSWEYK